MTSLHQAKKIQAYYSRIQGFCRTLANYEWLLIALLLPAVLAVTPLRFGLLFIIPLLWLIRRIGCGNFIESTPLDLALLFMAIMLLISLYATFDLTFSLSKIAGLFYGLGVYYAAVAAGGRSWSNLARGVILLLACGLVVAIFSLVGTSWKSTFPFLSAVTTKLPQLLLFSAAPEGFSPNQVAGTLLWILPIALAALVISLLKPTFWHAGLRRNQKWFAITPNLALLLLLGSVFILTQSRSAYVGLTLALLIGTLAFRTLSRRLIIIAFLSSFALAAGVIWLSIEPERQAETALITSFLESETRGEGQKSWMIDTDAINVQNRLEIWSRALYGLEDFAFTGIGLGTFRLVAPVLYPLFLIAPDRDIAHAHNQFLQVGLDLGLPGLIAYLALWLGAGAMLWQSWKLAPTTEARWLTLGFASALLAYLFYGFTETVALGAKPGFIFWLLLGLVSSLFRLTYASQGATQSASSDHRQDSNH